MITRSPPSRRVQSVTQPQSQPYPGGKFEEGRPSNSTSNGTDTSTHTPSGHHSLRKSINYASSLSASTSTPSSRRPEDAQKDYWLKQMAAAIAERDMAKAHAATVEEAKDTQIYELRQQFADERRQWKQTCDALQTARKYTSLQQIVQSGNERWESLSRYETLARESQLAIIQRDGKIQQFQDAEFWLRLQIKDLEKEIDSLHAEAEELSTNLLEQQEALEIKFAEAEEELFALRKTVETLEEYRKSIKAEVRQLKQTLAGKESTISALEAEKTNISTRLSTTDEALRAIRADLTKQKKTDKREDAEVDALRANKVDLEIKVKKVEADLKEEKAKTKAIEKQRKEAEAVERKATNELEAQLQAAKEAMRELQRAAKAQSAAPAPKIKSKKTREASMAISDDEAPPPQKSKSGKKPSRNELEDDSYRRRAATPSVSSDASLNTPPQPKPRTLLSPPQRKSTMMKPKSPAKPKAPSPSAPKKQKKSSSADKAPVVYGDDSEVELQAVPKTKTKAGTAVTRPRPTPRYEPKHSQKDDNDQDGVPTANSKFKPSAVAQGKRRARDEGPGVSGLTQSPGREPSSRYDAVEEEGNFGEPKRKKKRILGGALGAAPPRELHWPTSNGSDLGVGLPVLSPISAYHAPPRSFSGQQKHR